MNVVHDLEQLSIGGRRVCLAIGFFDGVHLGHQQIIRQTIADARAHSGLSLVLSFDRHPRTITAPDRVPPLIYSLSQRIRTIGSMGAETLLLLPFDERLSAKPGDVFIHELREHLGRVQSICVGANFMFGHQRSGNVALLKQLGAEMGFAVHAIQAVSLDGRIVSSTRVRERIQAGDLDAASQMLGRPYALCGQVVAGDKLGRQLGFPTANIDCTGRALPPHGVYVGQTVLQGKALPLVLNIGLRPTLHQPHPTLRVEAHILDFEGDLYGHELEVTVGEKLRDEQKFSSLDELRLQIARDVQMAREFF